MTIGGQKRGGKKKEKKKTKGVDQPRLGLRIDFLRLDCKRASGIITDSPQVYVVGLLEIPNDVFFLIITLLRGKILQEARNGMIIVAPRQKCTFTDFRPHEEGGMYA